MGLGCVPYLPKVGYIEYCISSSFFQSMLSLFYVLVSFHGHTIEAVSVVP